MGKFTMIIAGFYFCYYVGNIAYDLFLKKNSTIKDEETDEFSLEEFAKENQDEIKRVTIEDVENLNMPSSFNRSELFSEHESPGERSDLGYLREKFDAEQNIDAFQPENDQSSVNLIEPKKVPVFNGNDEGRKIEKNDLSAIDSNKEKFRNLLNLAETSVQLIAHPDGYKIYQSAM